MTWTERRECFLAAERRLLAGESKAALFDELTAAGERRYQAARMLARMVSPARRARYRWPNALLALFLAAAAVSSALSLPPAGGLAFALRLAWCAFVFGVPAACVLRWRSFGYLWAAFAALQALAWTADLPREVAGPALAGVPFLVLYAALLVLALVLWRRLFPDVAWWSGDPTQDAHGEYRFAD